METLEEMISRHEGECAVPYDDATGKPLKPGDTLQGYLTLGKGHNCAKPISARAIEVIFMDDLNEAINDVTHAFPWFHDLTTTRQRVIIDMCFNLGLPRLQKFVEFLKACELGDYETAANEILDSLAAKQAKSRYLELANMMRGSEPV